MPKKKSKTKRRTPPPRPAPARKSSPEWLPVIFFVLMGVGVIIIIGNYVGVFGPTGNWRMYYGLGLLTGGFVLATQWR